MVMILGLPTAAAAVDLGLTTLVALFLESYAFLAALAAASLFFLSRAFLAALAAASLFFLAMLAALATLAAA